MRERGRLLRSIVPQRIETRSLSVRLNLDARRRLSRRVLERLSPEARTEIEATLLSMDRDDEPTADHE